MQVLKMLLPITLNILLHTTNRSFITFYIISARIPGERIIFSNFKCYFHYWFWQHKYTSFYTVRVPLTSNASEFSGARIQVSICYSYKISFLLKSRLNSSSQSSNEMCGSMRSVYVKPILSLLDTPNIFLLSTVEISWQQLILNDKERPFNSLK